MKIIGLCNFLLWSHPQVALKHMRNINAGVQRQIQQEVRHLTVQTGSKGPKVRDNLGPRGAGHTSNTEKLTNGGELKTTGSKSRAGLTKKTK